MLVLVLQRALRTELLSLPVLLVLVAVAVFAVVLAAVAVLVVVAEEADVRICADRVAARHADLFWPAAAAERWQPLRWVWWWLVSARWWRALVPVAGQRPLRPAAASWPRRR